MEADQQSQPAQANTESTPPSLNEQPTVTTQHNGKTKYVFICLLLLFLVIFLGCIYYLKTSTTKSTSSKIFIMPKVTVSPMIKPTPTISVSSRTSPAGETDWKTYYSTNSLGISFKYPPTWTIAERDPSLNCAGESWIVISAPGSEISAAFSTLGLKYFPKTNDVNTRYSAYNIRITRAGEYDPNKCAPPESDLSGIQTDVIRSSDKILTGDLKNDSITYLNEGGLQGFVTNKYYDGSSNILSDSGIIPIKKQKYQFIIFLGYLTDYTDDILTPDINTLKTTNLYKNTLTILSTIN